MTRPTAACACLALAAALGLAAWAHAPTPAQADDAAEPAEPTQPENVLQHLVGNVSRLGDDGELHPVDASEFANVEYLAVYVSGKWCGSCVTFTPDLVTFYNEFKPDHPNFELVFVSSDRGEQAMKDHVTGDGMRWLVLDFEIHRTTPLRQYLGRHIPGLVLLDTSGNVLSDTYVDGEYAGPRRVMQYIQDNVPAANAVADADMPPSHDR